MKVILTAFGDRLRSDVIEWPEHTGPEAKLQAKWFPGEIAASIGREDDVPGLDRAQIVTLEFRQTGRTYEQDDGSLATEYELVNWYGGR